MSLRSGRVALVGVCLLCTLLGCGHLLESRAITDFTYAMQEKDLQYLRESTSPNFNQTALRRTEALEDLKILRLPQEPPSVVKVVDISPTEKQVTVSKTGKNQASKQSQLLYKLTRMDKNSPWVVDDIYVKRKQKGLKVTKSVTEQMDLLLTLRDFLDAWETGGREDILKVSSPALAQGLGALPPAYLLHLTRRIVPESKSSTSHRPEAQLDKNVAIVSLPRAEGKLMIAFRLIDEHWKVDDIALDPQQDNEAVTSVRKMAAVMNTALNFLATYQTGDKQALKKLSARKFYQTSLLPANLGDIRLPAPDDSPEDFQVTTYGQRATFLTSLGQQLFKVDLIAVEQDAGHTNGDHNKPESKLQDAHDPRFVVEEVTLYAAGSSQRKRMSAMFTARERARLFVEAVRRHNLPMIRSIVTPEFNERVWQRLDQRLLASLPLAPLQQGDLNIAEVKFRGNYTEIIGSQGPHAVVFRLRDWNGDLGVDDVRIAVPGQPDSLRERLETIIPITEFAAGIHNRDLGRLQQHSSTDFNRLVWAQVSQIPQIGFPIVKHLRTPVTSITQEGPTSTVRLGDETWGALLSMVKERGYWVIDEVELIAGRQSRQRTQMKHTIRVQLANGQLNATQQPTAPRPRRDVARPNPQPTVPMGQSAARQSTARQSTARQSTARQPTATRSQPGDDEMPPIPLPFR